MKGEDMKLTPLDIQQQQFRLKFRGFDIQEVDSFLNIIASQFEELIRENNLLKEESKRNEATIAQYQEKEKILRETMISAQKIAEEIKSNARREKELIISDAKLQAEKIIHSAHKKFAELMDDVSELKKVKARFAASLKSMIDSHLKLLDAQEEEEQALRELENKVASLKGNET
jgi:cell division initiation protein